MGGDNKRTGEKRLQILQTLAAMLEEPNPEKITTAALARRLDVSEAALYRHFASKAQMYEGLIEFIEDTLFGLIGRLTTDTADPVKQVESILSMLLGLRPQSRRSHYGLGPGTRRRLRSSAAPLPALRPSSEASHQRRRGLPGCDSPCDWPEGAASRCHAEPCSLLFG